MALILVVEDDEINEELVTRFLRREGHVVLHARDGEAGCLSAQKNLPDLILMDLGLPKLDGWEASERIKAEPETAHIPIIALTAHTLTEDVRRAVECGIDDYEVKPVVYQRLMRKIAALVEAQLYGRSNRHTERQ